MIHILVAGAVVYYGLRLLVGYLLQLDPTLPTPHHIWTVVQRICPLQPAFDLVYGVVNVDCPVDLIVPLACPQPQRLPLIDCPAFGQLRCWCYLRYDLRCRLFIYVVVRYLVGLRCCYALQAASRWRC